MTTADELETAYHEAGHAVAVLALGHHLVNDERGVAAELLGRAGAYVSWRAPDCERMTMTLPLTDDRKLYLLDAALIAMAGIAAEMRYSNKSSYIPERFADDQLNLKEYIDLLYPTLPPEERWSAIDPKLNEARELLALHWPATEAIARALHTERSLSQSRLEEMFSAYSVVS